MKEAVYETLREEFESAKLQEARENPALEVLDLPLVPERESFSPRLLIISTGTGFAVILSGVWILGGAPWREIGPEHPGRFLELCDGDLPSRQWIALRRTTTRANPLEARVSPLKHNLHDSRSSRLRGNG
jgi:hypothetical protein